MQKEVKIEIPTNLKNFTYIPWGKKIYGHKISPGDIPKLSTKGELILKLDGKKIKLILKEEKQERKIWEIESSKIYSVHLSALISPDKSFINFRLGLALKRPSVIFRIKLLLILDTVIINDPSYIETKITETAIKAYFEKFKMLGEQISRSLNIPFCWEYDDHTSFERSKSYPPATSYAVDENISINDINLREAPSELLGPEITLILAKHSDEIRSYQKIVYVALGVLIAIFFYFVMKPQYNIVYTIGIFLIMWIGSMLIFNFLIIGSFYTLLPLLGSLWRPTKNLAEKIVIIRALSEMNINELWKYLVLNLGISLFFRVVNVNSSIPVLKGDMAFELVKWCLVGGFIGTTFLLARIILLSNKLLTNINTILQRELIR